MGALTLASITSPRTRDTHQDLQDSRGQL